MVVCALFLFCVLHYRVRCANCISQVRGRGELQLGVLIENMRREGFELSVSPPTVLYQTSPEGEKLEPIGMCCTCALVCCCLDGVVVWCNI